jgi:hypothetical protein
MKLEELPEEFTYATSEELAKALGSTDEEAKQIDIRLERLAGNYPVLVKEKETKK